MTTKNLKTFHQRLQQAVDPRRDEFPEVWDAIKQNYLNGSPLPTSRIIREAVNSGLIQPNRETNAYHKFTRKLRRFKREHALSKQRR